MILLALLSIFCGYEMRSVMPLCLAVSGSLYFYYCGPSSTFGRSERTNQCSRENGNRMIDVSFCVYFFFFFFFAGPWFFQKKATIENCIINWCRCVILLKVSFFSSFRKNFSTQFWKRRLKRWDGKDGILLYKWVLFRGRSWVDQIESLTLPEEWSWI